MKTIGVDIGGTNIEVGLVDQKHKVSARAKGTTPSAGPEEFVKLISKLVDKVGGEPAALGVGVPGVISDNVLVKAPNLPGWSEKTDFRGMLAKKLGVPVGLGNDVDVGLLGEWVAGAAKGGDYVLGVWMGTGVGGSLILDGRPYHGASGGAGEFGHLIVHHDGALCTCGRRGCVEGYGGRRAMERTIEHRIAAGFETTIDDIRKKKGKGHFTSGVWQEALESKDPLATAMFRDAVTAVGVGVASAINLLDLDHVVIGGGFAEKLGTGLTAAIEEVARPLMLRPSLDLTVVPAKLGDDSGVVGAAALAKSIIVR